MSFSEMLKVEPANTGFSFEPFVSIPRAPKKRREICLEFQYGKCVNLDCPYRHVMISDQGMLQKADTEVCKYWLRGLCTEGSNCLWLHEFVKTKVPMCIYYQKFGECGNPECTFQHEHNVEHTLCAAYERGFCSLGKNCTLKHRKSIACPRWMSGYCPDPICSLAHPKMIFYDEESVRNRVRGDLINDAYQRKHITQQEMSTLLNTSIVCDRCRDPGHIAPRCPNGGSGVVLSIMHEIQEPGAPPSKDGCFNCGAADHIARHCPKRVKTLQGTNYE